LGFSWWLGTISGFARHGQFSATEVAARLAALWKKEHSRILLASALVWALSSLLHLLSALRGDCPAIRKLIYIGNWRHADQFLLCGERLGALRGTHDRTALILSFGFVLSESLRRSAISG